MEANFQQKVTIVHDAYCFQLREFSNDNLLGTKIDFEFLSENSPCSLNDLEHLSEISLLICFAQTVIPIHFLDDNLPSLNLPGWFFFLFHIVSFTTNSCPFVQQVYTRLTCITVKTRV